MDVKLKIKKPKIKKTNRPDDLLFWLAYGMFLFFGVLSTSFYYRYFMGSFYNMVKYSCLALLIFREFISHRYNLRSYILGIIFIGLVFVTNAQENAFTLVYILIFMFCARDIKFEKIARFSFWITISVLFFVIISAYLGIIENYMYVSSTRTRYYLGFRYSLYGPAFLFNCTCLRFYLKNIRITWTELILLFLSNLFLFVQTDSRLSFYLSTALVLICVFLKLKPDFFKKERPVISWLMIFSFVICFVVSLYFTFTYNKNIGWQKELNTILGNRLYNGQVSLLNSGVSFFGQKLEMVGNGLDAYGNQNTNPYNYVDCFYVQILQRYGIIFSAVWIIFLSMTLYQHYKKKNYFMMICLTFVAFHCVVDDLSLNLYYNTFWFSGIVLMERRRKKIVRKREKESPAGSVLPREAGSAGMTLELMQI